MMVKIEATIEGKVNLDVRAEVETFADLDKLGKKLREKVAGVRKALPDMADKVILKIRLSTE
jgi:hypothetical protein